MDKDLHHTRPQASNPFSFPENKHRETGREEVDQPLRELRAGGVSFRMAMAMGVVNAQRRGKGRRKGVEFSRFRGFEVSRFRGVEVSRCRDAITTTSMES